MHNGHNGHNERVYLDTRPHAVVLARPLAPALGLAAIGALLLALPWPLPVVGALALAAGALLALAAVWRWERTHVVVTAEKVLVAHGTVRRRTAAVPLRTVGAVELEQTLPGQLLGYGTLVVGPLEIDHVAQPQHVYGLVERLCEPV